MSYVVAVKCTDGVIIASDQKMTNMVGMRCGYKTHKIDWYESENLAFCSVGDDLCIIFVQVVRDKLRNQQFSEKSFMELKQSLIDCVCETRRRYAEYRTLNSIGPDIRELCGGNTFVVLRDERSVQLWSVDTSKAFQYPNPQPIDSCLPQGDAMNPAQFFLAHYCERPGTTESMIPLAVHTVLMAKNEFIDGIDVGVFTQSTFRTLTPEELSESIEISKSIDSYTAKALYRRS